MFLISLAQGSFSIPFAARTLKYPSQLRPKLFIISNRDWARLIFLSIFSCAANGELSSSAAIIISCFIPFISFSCLLVNGFGGHHLFIVWASIIYLCQCFLEGNRGIWSYG